jgi:hypothetical protein
LVKIVIGYVSAISLTQGLGLHPFHLLLAIAIIDLFFLGNEAVDRILAVIASVVGMVPVFGWFAMPVLIDPLSLVIGVWTVFLTGELAHLRKPPSLQSIAALPPLFSAALSFQWWSGLSKGSPAEVLERLIPIWDLSAHFNFFLTCFLKKTYIIATPPPAPNLRWEGTEYPAGIHYVWARFAATHRNSVIRETERAIPIFANSIVVTVSVAIAVVGLAAVRLSGSNYRRLAYGCIGSGIAVALLTFGPMSQTIYAGFANMAAVVVCLAIFVTFLLKEHGSPIVSAWVIGCSIVGVAYNWYPIALLLSPAVLLFMVRAWRGQSWKIPVIFSAFVGLGAGPAVLQTLSLGVEHLELPGGVQPFPHGLFVSVLLAAFGMSLMCWNTDKLLPLALVGATPLIAAVALGVRLRVVTDSYPYYFHKASLFIGTSAVLVVILGGVFVTEHAISTNPGVLNSQRSKLGFVSGALVIGFGLTHTFGYWGPDYPTFSGGGTALGVLTRNDIMKGDTNYALTAELVIDKISEVRALSIEERSCLTMIIPLRLGAEPGTPIYEWQLTLTNVWFHGLTESYTFQAKEQAYMAPWIAPSLGSESDLVNAIVNVYDPQSNCIYSSEYVIRELQALGPQWRTRSLES